MLLDKEKELNDSLVSHAQTKINLANLKASTSDMDELIEISQMQIQ
jgi:hypothetical protein